MSALLETRALVKRFGGVVATDHVSLETQAGEIHAVIGPNGAGKTTLIAQLAGTVHADSGSVRFAGEDVSRLPCHARVARGLARSFQITSTFRSFTVLDNLVLAAQARSGTSFRFWRPRASEGAIHEEALAVARRIGLDGREHVRARELAHGEQRQLEVGLALSTRPKLLLLDEPMAGMGPQESERMITLIGSIKTATTILLVEHDMDAVFRLADRVSVLVAGRILATGTPADIRADEAVRKAYLGEDL